MAARQKIQSDYGDTPEEADIYWLRAWGERLKSWIGNTNITPGRFDSMAFRPDELARDGLLRMGIRFPQVAGQVREFLEHAERSYADLCRLLPPDGCPSCKSESDFSDEEGIRHCWVCGQRTVMQPVDQRGIEIAEETAWNSYESLSRVVIVAADAVANQPQGSDDSADNGEFFDGVAHPQNPDVRDLCVKLSEKSDEQSENEIARLFVGGSEPSQKRQAKSLLRQARRFPHLWKKTT